MTSKNCCFKLMREDAKRRLWLISLLGLMFVFIYPVAVVSIIGDYTSNGGDPSIIWAELVNRLSKYYSSGNDVIAFALVPSAIICGITSFSFLSSKKQVDFYHSIPIKRETLFWAQYLDGILMVFLLYGASMFVSLLIVAVNGAFSLGLLKLAVTSLLVNTSLYILLYSTVVAAAMMTGNFIITMLATGVFFFYGPAVIMLVNGYFEIWFETFYSSGSWESWLKFSSPFIFYTMSVQSFTAGKALGVAAAVCIITLLSLWMYKKRPSEAAGKAMAFEKTKTVIKILLVIPISMAGCIMFWGIHYTLGWSLFGLLAGGILSHCIIEIIYAFDFRRLFANKLHLAVCLLASILLFLGFKLDITGYDKYIPKKEELQSAAISIYGLDEWVTYGSPVPRIGDSDSYSPYYYWDYQDSTDYIFDNMDLEQTEPVLEVVKAAMAEGDVEEQAYYGKLGDNFFRIHVKYTLKSGRNVYRSVMLPAAELDKLSAIYTDPEYKTGAFPLMKQTIDDTVKVAYQEMSHITKVSLDSTAEMEELLNVYKEEWKLLSFDTKKAEQPIGMIQFQTRELEYAASQEENKNSDISQRTYYPVYPSFTKTIQLLEAAGVYPGTKLKVDKITKITVTGSFVSDDYSNDFKYDTVMAEPVSPVEKVAESEAGTSKSVTKTTDTNGNITYEITGRDDIEKLYPSLVPRDYADLNTLNPYDSNMRVDVEYGEGLDKYSYQFALIPEKLSNEYRTMFEYDKRVPE